MGVLSVSCVAFAQDGVKANAELRKEMLDLSKSVSDYSKALGDSIASLEALRGADAKQLPKTFAAFRKSSANLDSARKSTEGRIANANKKKSAYFAAWEKSIETISNPELKTAGVERRRQVMAEHDKLSADAQALRQRTVEFATKQQELQRFLGTDMTLSAVAAAKGPIDEVLQAGKSLKPLVDDTANKLKVFGAGRA